MKYKTGEYVNFSTPIGDKMGYIIEVKGDEAVIKADSFPFSIWRIKINKIIAK